MSVSRPSPQPFGETLAGTLTLLLHDLFGGYRPERHYMRGPGPKWREKHAAPARCNQPSQVTGRDWVKAAA